MEDYDIILGKPWLTKLNPKIDWKKNIVKFKHKGANIHLKSRK